MTKSATHDEPGGIHASLSLGDFLPYRLSVVAESVSRAFAANYQRRFGISIAEWRVMAVLGERSPQSTQEVIGRTRMDRVKVSRAAIRMVDKGLISRDALLDDQRAHAMRLTALGLDMYREIVPLAHALQKDLVEAFSDADMRILDRLLRKIEDRVDGLSDPFDGADAEKSGRVPGGRSK